MGDKLKTFSRNTQVLKWIYALQKTPLYFFVVIYFHFVTDSYFMTANLVAFGKIVQAIMEVPTGILSDKFLGRKGTYLAGSIFFVMAFSCYALGTINFLFLFLGRFLFGIAASLHSGNTNSLLYDTLRDGRKEKEYHAFLGRHHSYKYYYWSFSLFVTGFLAHYFGIIWVVYYCIFQRVINTILGFFIHEPISHKETIDNSAPSKKHLKKAILGFIKNKELGLLAIISILRNGFVFGVERFSSNFYKLFLSYHWIGVLTGISLFINSFIARFSERVTEKIGIEKTFLFIEYFSIPIQAISYLFPGPYSIITIETSMQTIPLMMVSEEAIFHKHFTNEQRATMETLIAICSTIFLSIFMALLGYLADIWSLHYALLFGVGCRLTLIPLIKYTFRKDFN